MQDVTRAASDFSELALFLKALAEEGRAVVSPRPLAGHMTDAAEVLRQLDCIAREELGAELPLFSPEVALWAGRLFYHLCQFTVCRDIGAERVAAVCREACPLARSPATDWSADLTLRQLPKHFQLARPLSEGDPLVQHLQQIASAWPLSAVGIVGADKLSLESFIEHPALRRLYLDRIVAVEDISRLNDPRVSDLLRADLGFHHELAPTIASKLYPANS